MGMGENTQEHGCISQVVLGGSDVKHICCKHFQPITNWPQVNFAIEEKKSQKRREGLSFKKTWRGASG